MFAIPILFATVLGFFLSAQDVHAEKYTGNAMWPSEFISDVYIKKLKADGTGKYQQARFIRRSEDNAFVYCLQPFVDIDNNYVYNVARSDYETYLNMTEEQWERISLLAYYGYGYENHNEHKWYAITQMLIWRTAEPTSTFFFTDTLNGARNDNLFLNEMAELESLVANHNKAPKFNTNEIVIPLGQTITLNDINSVLSNYQIKEQSNVSASINGNNLTIKATGLGNASIKLTKEDTKHSVPPIIYFVEGSQNTFRLGSYDPLVKNINIEVIGGKVAIQKVDSETLKNNAQGNATLKGAVYGVYKEDGTKLAELKTDENGYAKSDYLPSIGKLYVQEIKQSNGYKLDRTKYYVELTSENLEPTIQVKEEIIKGKIKITKLDSETNTCKAQGEATLFGAKYKIVNSNGDVVDTLTIGDDCTATSKDIPYGNYKILEEKSSVGYYIDSKSYDVFVNGETIFNVTSKEQVIKGKIKINKVDSETNSCTAQGQATLKGAVYEILDLKGNVVDTLTIGDDCSATSKYLPYSQYKIREKNESQGYYIDTNIYSANITEDNVITITSKERVIKNYISILKQYDYVDGTTQFLNAEANIKFEIYYPNGTKYREITTDKNGYATLDIPYGVWKFHQVNSNTGFEKIYDFYITVDEDSELEQYYNILNNKLSAYLQVFKVDSETGKTIELADTTFKILNVDTNKYVSQYVGGKVYSEFKTDETGKLITYLKLEAGNYKLIEISSPKSYLINTDGLTFTIGDNTHYNYTTYGAFITVYFKDTPIKGQVEVNKTGEKFVPNDGSFSYEKVALENVVFNIYADEDIKTADGKHLYYSKGTLVDVITTDKNGYAISKKLPLGKYKLVEVKTNSTHVLDSKEHHFELTEIDNKTAVVYESFSILNKYQKGELEFTKTDLINGEAIANTKIEIYTDSDELIFSGITDKEGKIIIKNLPINQKFYLVESEPATGYVKTEEKVYFEIKANGEIVKASMTNKPITGKLEFTKTDISTSEPLPNTLIEIYNAKTNELVFSGRTDENGMIVINKLRYNDYVLYEKEAPESYILNEEPMYFSIKEDGEIVKCTMTNQKITSKVKIIKVDENGNTLSGVKIGIYDLQGNEIGIYTTNENGEIELELEYNDYMYKELEALENFALDENEYYFSIIKNDEIIELKLINKLIEIEVPNTEKDSYLIPIAIGIILSGGIILFFNKRRKK